MIVDFVLVNQGVASILVCQSLYPKHVVRLKLSLCLPGLVISSLNVEKKFKGCPSNRTRMCFFRQNILFARYDFNWERVECTE